jgi:O-antigen/teichoic acid export membrane protein
MNLAQGFLLALTGHVLRLGSGMLVFVVLARTLGPSGFGEFSYWLAIATLLTIPVNYGFGTMVLHRFGSEPEQAQRTMNEVLTARLALGATVLVVGGCALPWLSPHAAVLFAALLVAQVGESFNELYTLGFRAKSQFREETITASLVSAWHIIVMLAVALWLHDVVAAAVAFAASRLSGMLLTRRRCHRYFGIVRTAPLATTPGTLRRSWAYALELGLFTTYSQLDSLIINAFLGPTVLGLYQAGMKLNQGASRIAPVLAQILLPELSRRAVADQGCGFARYAARALGVFAAIGACGAAVLMVNPAWFANLLFGQKYAGLAPLLPLFSCMLFMQFVETGAGLTLVARGLQGKKVWLVAAQLIVLLSAGAWALRAQGLPGWQLSNVASVAALVVGYGWLHWRHRRACA